MNTSFILNELGEDREYYFNAMAPPVMQTSNFAYHSVSSLRKAFEDEMGSYLYSRGLNPTVDILRRKLAALDCAEDCLVFNSGVSAIYAAVMANVKSGDHIISVRNPYTWTKHLFDSVLPRFGVPTTYVDGSAVINFEKALTDATTVIYLESPNSWDYSLQDLEAVASLARSRGILTIIDNSYCTPLYQRPLSLGIDISLQTATKYIGGHSDTLGGVLSASGEMIRKIFSSEFLVTGAGMPPFNAWLMIRGLRTLHVRMERISASTRKIVEWLKQHPGTERVIYPMDPEFPQYELACRQMTGAGGLLTFTLRHGTAEKITRLCESLKHIPMAVSWGGHESLILPRLAGMDPDEFDPGNITHQHIRFYTGLEDPAYLIADLDQAFSTI